MVDIDYSYKKLLFGYFYFSVVEVGLLYHRLGKCMIPSYCFRVTFVGRCIGESICLKELGIHSSSLLFNYSNSIV